MGITFSTNLPPPEGTVEVPCLCAQMGDGFILMMRGQDSIEVRADLAKQADPRCMSCGGTGVENTPVESPHHLDLCLDNARRLLAALGLAQDFGQCPVADARRALVRARNMNLGNLVRAEETTYGGPRVQEDGTVAMRPIRSHSAGLSVEGLVERIDRFESFVRSAVAAGATEIHWG
jgi:hypothetical protein